MIGAEDEQTQRSILQWSEREWKATLFASISYKQERLQVMMKQRGREHFEPDTAGCEPSRGQCKICRRHWVLRACSSSTTPSPVLPRGCRNAEASVLGCHIQLQLGWSCNWLAVEFGDPEQPVALFFSKRAVPAQEITGKETVKGYIKCLSLSKPYE